MISCKSAKKIYAACQLLKEAEKDSRMWGKMIQVHRQGLLFTLVKDWSQMFGPSEIEEMTEYLRVITRTTEKKA